MTLNELFREIKREIKNGNCEYEVRLFAHDHNPEIYDNGVGTLNSVNEYYNDKNEIFIALST